MDMYSLYSIKAFRAAAFLFCFLNIPFSIASTNLALNGVARQSSDYSVIGPADRAIDGNTDGNFFANSVTHTDPEQEAWWEVDLGSIHYIAAVNTYNRTDCCFERATGFHVFVSDTPFTGTTVADSQAQADVLDLYESGEMGTPTVLSVNRTGRYIRVQLTGSEVLNLAEVEVIEGQPPVPGPGPATGADTDRAEFIRKKTIEQVGRFMEERARLIVRHQPDLARQIERLEGRYSNRGGIRAFDLAYTDSRIPFAADIGTDSIRFAYSLRQAGAEGAGAGLRYTGASPVSDVFSSAYGSEDALVLADNTRRDETADIRREALLATEKNSAGGQVGSRDIWAEGKVSKFEAGDSRGKFGILHLGADYVIRPGVLLGMAVQGEWTYRDEKKTDSRTESFGFMLLPYVTTRLADRVYLDARAGWGKAYNDIHLFGADTDSFDSERWLVSTELVGIWSRGEYEIQPELRLSYFRESSDSYTDSRSLNIPGVDMETGTLEFGPKIRKNAFLYRGNYYSPFVSVKGIWTFARENTAEKYLNSLQLADEGVRGRLDMGLNVYSDNGSQLDFSVNYDGIGDDSFSSWGLALKYDYRF